MTNPVRVRVAAWILPLGLLSGGCELMIAGPREQVSDVWERTYPIAPTGTLEVANTNGSIRVSTHAEPTIQVKARRTARAVTEQGARELLGRLALEQEASPDLVRLAVPRQGLSPGQQVEVQYDILVPASIAATLTTVNGGVVADGLAGSVALESVNGPLEATHLSALRKAETVNGGVTLRLTSLPAQGSRVETVNGGVTVHMPPAQAANLSVRTVNGGITVDGFAAESDRERRRRHYESRVNGGGPTLRIETVNGGVKVEGRTARPEATTSAAP